MLSLIAQDSDFITEQFSFVLQKPTGVFGLVSSTLIFIYFIGWGALTGLVLMGVTLILARLFGMCRVPVMKKEERYSDKRIQMVSDMISGIRTII